LVRSPFADHSDLMKAMTSALTVSQ
jgi:hypothetical protein